MRPRLMRPHAGAIPEHSGSIDSPRQQFKDFMQSHFHQVDEPVIVNDDPISQTQHRQGRHHHHQKRWEFDGFDEEDMQAFMSMGGDPR